MDSVKTFRETWTDLHPAPLFIIGTIAFLTLGIRFITSTLRHVVHFQMPDETLTWRSPATDYNYKADAAKAVRDYARERGILREWIGKRPTVVES